MEHMKPDRYPFNVTTRRTLQHCLVSWQARRKAGDTFGPAIGTGRVDGNGLMLHELQKISSCAHSVIVLLGHGGKYVPRTKTSLSTSKKS